MLDLNTFFFTKQFIPHGHCYLWKPGLVWLHVVSDSLIALALISKALALPSPTQLQAAIATLKTEITERQQAQKALLESQTRLKINSISPGMMLGMSVEQIIERTVKQISENFNTFRVAYSTINDQGNLTIIHCIEPQEMPRPKGLVIDLTAVQEYLNALRTNKPFLVDNFAQNVWLASLFDVINAYGHQAQLNVPFRYPNNSIGLRSLYRIP